ncbi:MAG: hypothetical protein U0N15_06395 [Bifidobacterium choerinum]
MALLIGAIISIAVSVGGYLLGGVFRGLIHLILRGVTIFAMFSLLLTICTLICYWTIAGNAGPFSVWATAFLWFVAIVAAQTAEDKLPTAGAVASSYLDYRRDLKQEREDKAYERSIDPHYREYEDNLDRLVEAKRGGNTHDGTIIE